MSTAALDIYEVHSLGCSSTNSEDSPLGTITHSPSSLDMYEVHSLPCAKYENPSNDEGPQGLQHLKCQPPATVSKSPNKVNMYESPYKEHKMCLALPRFHYKVSVNIYEVPELPDFKDSSLYATSVYAATVYDAMYAAIMYTVIVYARLLAMKFELFPAVPLVLARTYSEFP